MACLSGGSCFSNVCTWLTLLVISASTLSLLFLLMWEPSTSVCSLFKLPLNLLVLVFRLIHDSSMVGRVGEEGLGGPETGQGRVIMLATIDTSFGSPHNGRWGPDRFYWTFKSYGSFS